LSILSTEHVQALLHHYGYGLIGAVVGLEATGLPLPGESLLIAAALYAATTHELAIGPVVLAAACGAILGDNLGYVVGRNLGARLLERYGRYVLLTPERLRRGHRLFEAHGGKLVLFGRFTALLRTVVALLAGATRMRWPHFLFWNALGGIAWACLYGFGAYSFGTEMERVRGPVGIAAAVAAVAALAAAAVYGHRRGGRAG
jgi:membrane protein DedA with SNARE-associated domain